MLSHPKRVTIADGTQATVTRQSTYRLFTDDQTTCVKKIEVYHREDKDEYGVYDPDEDVFVNIASTEEQAEQLAFRHLGIRESTTDGVPIHRSGDLDYIRIGEIGDKTRQVMLRNWMQGQTRPLIDGLEPQDAVYVHDYESWRRGDP